MNLETTGSSAIQAAQVFDARMEKLNELLEAERVYTNEKIAEGQKQVAEETENKVREELDTIKKDLVLLDAEDQAEFKQLVKDEINFEAEQRGFVLPEEKQMICMGNGLLVMRIYH